MAQPNSKRTGARSIRLVCESLETRQLLSGSSVAPSPSLDAPEFRTDHILVQFRNDAIAPVALAGTKIGEEIALVPGLHEVLLTPGITIDQALAAYRADAHVIFAQPDYYIVTERLPNDPLFPQQWAYQNTINAAASISAPRAWDTTMGSGRAVVAVIDTGVDYNHPDLAANMWRNTAEIPGNSADDDRNGFIDDVYGYNFSRNNGNPFDDNGHGTHVAGIIGAVGNNGTGVSGVNWNVKIMALKFMDASGRGATSDALRALNYAVQMGATISNNSWTAPSGDLALEAGIRNAGLAGHIYVAAAGNLGRNIDVSRIYPASFTTDNIVAVAALDSGNRMPSWSNYGPNSVDIAAPGSGVYSTLPNSRYGTMSGTSMATPFVTGALALVRDQHPEWNYRQVINQVLSTTDAVSSLTGRIKGGKLNLANAVGSAATPPPPPASDVLGAQVASLAALITNNRVTGLRITFSEPIQASTFTAADVLNLSGPNGALAVTEVTPVPGSNTQFDVRFPEQAQTGTYGLTLGTDIRDFAGNALNQNGNATSGEIPADRYTGSVLYTNSTIFNAAGLPAPLVDRGIKTFTIQVDNSFIIDKARVKITLTHGWMSDLVIKLRSPGGTEVLLVNRRGGSGKGYTDTLFDDAATKFITQGLAPFTGNFRPESPLSVLRNKNSQGAWTLIVEDKAGGDTGTMLSWSLLFDQAAGGAALPRASTKSLPPSALVQALARQAPALQLATFTTSAQVKAYQEQHQARKLSAEHLTLPNLAAHRPLAKQQAERLMHVMTESHSQLHSRLGDRLTVIR